MATTSIAQLPLHQFHSARGASFTEFSGVETVASYGSVGSEYLALTRSAALIDLSSRGRLCLLGADREKFLHGQVTNDVLRLKTGEGCYAALVTAKGKIQSDLFIYKLPDELLLDFEPAFAAGIIERLNNYIIADAVEVADVSSLYGLLYVSGPATTEVLSALSPVERLPRQNLTWISLPDESGETYIINNPRFGLPGFDLFVPIQQMERTAIALEEAGRACGAAWAGFEATEVARIENGIPRFGADMNENTLAPEAEIQDRAISYSKGCYIGQEIIARIRTYGQVAKALRLIRLPAELPQLPASGTKLYAAGKEVGSITSSTLSPKHGAKVALAYVRKETNAAGATVHLGEENGPPAQIIGIPGKL